MSDLKPPSQINPGPAPVRLRTAICRADGPTPTSMKAGDVELVMERLLWLSGLNCSAQNGLANRY
jgi:hypothetical protein